MLGIETIDDIRCGRRRAVNPADKIIDHAIAGRDTVFGKAGPQDGSEHHIVRRLHRDDAQGIKP